MVDVTSDDSGLTLTFSQRQIPVDPGKASSVELRLELDADDNVIAAFAHEHDHAPLLDGGDDTTAAVSGSVNPVVHARDGSAEAGALSVDFGWGTIDGTYDTAQ